MSESREYRKRLKQEYEGLFVDLSKYLFEVDPVGVNYEINSDEYDPEVGTILPRIVDLDTVDEIASILREEFNRWFGDPTIYRSTYEDLAADMLTILRRYRLNSQSADNVP
jgi:hypothetical protein